MNDLEREVQHLPPLARARAMKALGQPQPPPEEIKVFVYGTLLSGERNARWAMDARRTPAWAIGTIYDTGYGFPAYTREGENRILGELLTVNAEGFRSMDRLEGYPRLYRREEITVFPSCGGQTRAWVYIMNALPKDARPIESGSWKLRNRDR